MSTPIYGKHGRVLTKHARQGHCNICGKFAPLTEDHVPPKGTLPVARSDLLHIIELLGSERPLSQKRYRTMQSGVSFQSICGTCNNDLLGSRYDRELIAFSNAVTALLQTPISIPTQSKVRVAPGLVARAVLGHLFALGLQRTERTPILTAAAEFVMDDTLPLPNEIEIFFWLYPYSRQIAIRDGVLIPSFQNMAQPIVFWCLKYFPLGFLVTWNNTHHKFHRIQSLRPFMLHSGTVPIDIWIDLTVFPPQDWPEAPTESGAVLYGDGAIGAIPRANSW